MKAAIKRFAPLGLPRSRMVLSTLRRLAEVIHYVVHYIMQSIFSPAARRDTLSGTR